MKYTYLFLFCFLSCKSDTSTPTLQVLAPAGFHLMIQTGLPDIETTNQLNFSAKKYHIKFYNVGCITEKQRLDSINKIYDSISAIVKLQFGNNWLRDLKLELDTINEVKQIAYEEILKRKILHDESYYYLGCPALRKNEYLVRIYSIGYENDKSQMHFKYYIGVDYRKKLVFEISRAAEEK